jgi:hypothetical protein
MLTVQCPQCGSYNDDSASTCYLCQAPLPGAAGRKPTAEPAPSRPTPAIAREREIPDYRRPGCVTVYAAWMFISGILGVFFALYLPTFLADNLPILLDPANYPAGVDPIDPETVELMRSFVGGYAIAIFLFSVTGVLIGWGLWTMRNWARVIILVTQGLALIAGIVGLFLSIASTNGNLFVCGSYLASLIFPAIVFLWFFLNRNEFR